MTRARSIHSGRNASADLPVIFASRRVARMKELTPLMPNMGRRIAIARSTKISHSSRHSDGAFTALRPYWTYGSS
jgi:hypothetical protein